MNEARYDARLRLLPCVVCVLLEQPPRPCVELHHVGDPGTERNPYGKVPICDPHHQGPEGIHGMRRRAFVKASQISDVMMLSTTIRLFVGDLP